VCIRQYRRDGAIIPRSFVCAKEGFRVEKERKRFEGRVKWPRAETRVGCKAMLVVKTQDSCRWVVILLLRNITKNWFHLIKCIAFDLIVMFQVRLNP